ncbi:MAG TPA: divalent-cation tolerance protein CutA [Hyphomicrobiaceae bacterium]
MQANDKPILIYATFPSLQDAERIGAELVDCRLAACVNIIPGMTSIYIWNDKRQHDSECVGIIKTRQTLAEPVMDKVRSLHSYDNPALGADGRRLLGGISDLDRGADGRAEGLTCRCNK